MALVLKLSAHGVVGLVCCSMIFVISIESAAIVSTTTERPVDYWRTKLDNRSMPRFQLKSIEYDNYGEYIQGMNLF